VRVILATEGRERNGTTAMGRETGRCSSDKNQSLKSVLFKLIQNAFPLTPLKAAVGGDGVYPFNFI
jgi:hypothetical protein